MTARFHRVKGAAVLLVTGALIATTAACGSDTQSTDTSQPGVPDKVTAGVIAIVDVAPIYLGKQKGFFTEKNIELTLQTATGWRRHHPAGGRPAVRLRLQQRGLPASGAVPQRRR